MIDYAHLRAPLPKDLKGSEIFVPKQGQPHPESYFLMVSTEFDSRVRLSSSNASVRL